MEQPIRKAVAASSAWPKVWPRLSSARSPFSRSSARHDRGLARQEVAMACSRGGAARENIVCGSSQPGEEGFVAEHAVLAISA